MPFRTVTEQREFDDPNYLEKERDEVLANIAKSNALKKATEGEGQGRCGQGQGRTAQEVSLN